MSYLLVFTTDYTVVYGQGVPIWAHYRFNRECKQCRITRAEKLRTSHFRGEHCEAPRAKPHSLRNKELFSCILSDNSLPAIERQNLKLKVPLLFSKKNLKACFNFLKLPKKIRSRRYGSCRTIMANDCSKNFPPSVCC